MSESPVFDIFCGDNDYSAKWIEAVIGYDAAVGRMHRLANQKPGRYFLFRATTNEILAVIETGQHQDQRSGATG